MLNTLKPVRYLGLVLAFAVLATAGVGAADSWVQIAPDGTAVVAESTPAQAPQLDVRGYDDSGIRLAIDVAGVELLPRKTKGGMFMVVTWPDAAVAGEIGTPALPVIRRLFIAQPDATVTVQTVLGATAVIDVAAIGAALPVMPQQAPIPKIEGALENAPFDFDPAAYAVDADYLAEPAIVTEMGIARGQRLFLLEVHPVTYNPVAQTLTLRSEMNVTIKFTGGTEPFSSMNPLPGLERIVLNPDYSAPARRGSGNYLIVTPTAFESQIASFATHKAAKGFNVNTYVAPSSSASVIKDYIQSLWGGPDAPDYVLLVGDTQYISHWVGGGSGSPDTDLPYSCMDGTGDWHPDLAIGRFPADDAGELADIIAKTIYYDNGQFADPDYFKRAVFMASEDNWPVSEGTHNWVIENYMIPNEIVSDKLYCHTYNATTQQVRDAFNDGRFFGIYSGHGASTYWADGPPFYQSDVEGLMNENMYSLVMSFACSTGDYAYYDECFTETWILVPDKGAVAIWGSSVSSYWTEDDVLEKRWFDAIYDADDDVPSEFGPTFNDARMRYLDQMGEAGGTTRRYFEMYNLMGDPSLRYPGTCSDAGTLTLDRAEYACEGTVQITASDCGLNLDENAVDTVQITVSSDSEPGGETLELTETNPGSAEFVGSIAISTADDVGVLLVGEGDTITATYIDEDDGQGGTNVEVTATALVDCTPPNISNIQTIDIEPRTATVTFDADEIVRGTVHYGLSCDSLTETATGGYDNPASVNLTGLQDQTTYFYIVVATDLAGNEATDDNAGNCYTFTTPDIPDFFTELFTGGNDLDYQTLLFTPNETVDFYAGCVEDIDDFPIDPSGGTNISLSDDDYEYVPLDGGETVTLYGVAYDGFYIGSNGYVTFGAGDSEYDETLADHFDLPRVSALFDDLNPSSGGTVSWKQMDDRAVVTWQNVPEVSSSNNNTFQIELHFNGDVRISYLTIDAGDGLAGLSEGDGVDPDYYPSDLSGLGPCGPRPPTASDGEVSTPFNTAVQITLMASDDGLPEPASLDYIISSLPVHGVLSDPGAGVIDSVPYTLADGGNEVLYTPELWFMDEDSFQFYTDDGGVPPEGGSSNIATVVITVTPPGPQPIYEFPLDSDPGWFTEGQWAFGQPTGGGSHNADPASGYTGDNVYGYNLDGDYTTSMPEYFLTTTAIDCSELSGVELRFWRWLGVESSAFDHAAVEVSNDGTSWTPVWTNPTSSVSDSSWSQMALDISAVADEQPTVYVRWSLGPTDTSVTYPGWNIDDVEICAVLPPIPGDLDGDGCVDLADLAQLLAHYGMTGGAGYGDGDLDADGNVDLADLAELLAHYGEGCA